jgi:signal transduction histidine kinase
LQRRLLWAFLFLAFFNLALSLFFFQGGRKLLEQEVEQRLVAIGRLIKEDLPPGINFLLPEDKESLYYQHLRKKIEKILLQTQIKRITLFNRAGQIIIDSEDQGRKSLPFWRIDRREIAGVLAQGKVKSSFLYQGEGGNLYKCVYLPVVEAGRVEAVLRLEAGAGAVALLKKFEKLNWGLGFFLIFSAAFFSLFFTARIFHPLRRLTSFVEAKLKGDLSAPIKIFSRDEIGFLAQSFNQLMATIEVRFKEEKKYFEERVEDLKKISLELAHEIKNPLASLQSSVELLRRVKNEGQREVFINQILEEISRLTVLVNKFLNFGRQRKLKFTLLNLPSLLEECFSLAGFSKKVTLQKDYQKNLPLVPVDETEIKSAFLNLLVNAKEAMSNQGEITVVLRQNQEFISCQIKDTGKGIPEEVKKKIFQPFFTTKEKGLGLGLSTTAEIIKLHQGKISCWNNNKGTTFEILLPLKQK